MPSLSQRIPRLFTDQTRLPDPLRSQINPGEVKVLRGRSNIVLYTDGSGSDNPYQKEGRMRVKIEPTRLSVKVCLASLSLC